MTNMKPFVEQGGICRTQNVGFLRFFSVVLFLLPLLLVHTAYGDINADLIEAAKTGNTAKVKQLLRKGADVKAEQEHGQTALMFAAEEGQAETVKILVEAGADVNAKARFGDTALMLSAELGHTEIVNILKQAGARQ